MTIAKREALAQRLGQAERAQAESDGSTRARMRLAIARGSYRAAEQLAVMTLGARQALDVVC